jgi:hypothetical protein
VEPYATVGIVNFDGQGKLTLSVTQSIGGLIYPPTPIPGIYSLNENCGGRLTLSSGAVLTPLSATQGAKLTRFKSTAATLFTLWTKSCNQVSKNFELEKIL